jgi:hypothetical protein
MVTPPPAAATKTKAARSHWSPPLLMQRRLPQSPHQVSFFRSFRFLSPHPLPNRFYAAAKAGSTKASRSGSGVAAQRAALVTLQVAVDEPSSVSSERTPGPANVKSLQSKDVLKLHLCQVRRSFKTQHLPAITRPPTLCNRSSPRPGSAGWSKPCRSTAHSSLSLFL